MSVGHEEFLSTLKMLRDDKRVDDNEFVSKMIMLFDERLTRLEDAVNELLDDEEL